MLFDRLSAFGIQLYDIFEQKLIICNLLKIFVIDNRKITSKKNKTGFYTIMKCWHITS